MAGSDSRNGRTAGPVESASPPSHRDSGGGQRLSKRMCYCFGVCGETVFFETLTPKQWHVNHFADARRSRATPPERPRRGRRIPVFSKL